jgi:hypothetical protein
VTHRTSPHVDPSGQSPGSGWVGVPYSQVFMFGRHGRFHVPATHPIRAGGATGSRIAGGNRLRRREASLNRTAGPRDHRAIRDLLVITHRPNRTGNKFAAKDEKALDPEHSRSVQRHLSGKQHNFAVVVPPRRAGSSGRLTHWRSIRLTVRGGWNAACLLSRPRYCQTGMAVGCVTRSRRGTTARQSPSGAPSGKYERYGRASSTARAKEGLANRRER